MTRTLSLRRRKRAEFADQSARPATASVRLQLHPGATLSRDAVDGIRRFVAASVAGLDPANVTMLDDRGVALGENAGAQDDPSALERSLQSALDAALGAGVTIVRVHAEYTHATSEERNTRRAPVGGDPIERTTASESYDGGGKKYAKNDVRDDRGTLTQESVTRARCGSARAHFDRGVCRRRPRCRSCQSARACRSDRWLRASTAEMSLRCKL